MLSIAMPYSNLFLILTSVLFGVTIAATHNVRDAGGWTAAGMVDYTNWASTNNFQLGDQLDFKYNHDFHDVMEVSRQYFESCNSNSPILTYTTGNDTVELTAAGHHYFVCSIPGRCDAGQKLHIFTHCDANAPDPTRPDHRSNSSSFLNISCILFLPCYSLWHIFV